MKGILFKPWKIKAIAEGGYDREWQTRRVMKPQAYGDSWVMFNGIKYLFPEHIEAVVIEARYQVGDILYIKEAWAISSEYDNYEPSDPIIKDDPTVPIHFSLDGDKPEWCGRVRSPMHLLAVKARYFIQITGVRAEKLQEINQVRHDDVLKEGYPFGYDVATLNEHPVTTYARLWDSINKEHQWVENPWVWAYSFKLTKREGRQRR